MRKRYDTCYETWTSQMRSYTGSGSARGGCLGNLCPLFTTHESSAAGMRKEYNHCVSECGNIIVEHASIRAGCITNMASKYPETFFGANWDSMKPNQMLGVCKPLCFRLRQTQTGSEICNGGCLGAVSNIKYDYAKSLAHFSLSHTYGHFSDVEYVFGKKGEKTCPTGTIPLTDGPTACRSALVSLNIPVGELHTGTNVCYKSSGGKGWNTGHNNHMSTIICVTKAAHKWTGLSKTSCQGCASDNCKNFKSLTEAATSCDTDQKCNSVICAHGNTNSCEKRSNTAKLVWKKEDCYRPSPNGGKGFRTEFNYCYEKCKKDYTTTGFFLSKGGILCKGACAGTVISRYQQVFYD